MYSVCYSLLYTYTVERDQSLSARKIGINTMIHGARYTILYICRAYENYLDLFDFRAVFRSAMENSARIRTRCYYFFEECFLITPR